MKGVLFDNYHSYYDFSLILNSKEIAAPDYKKMQVKIDGTDGILDYTDYFGSVKFENRQLKFVFSTVVPQEEFLNLFSQIQNALQGRKMKIILDDDPDFFYVGRVNVDKWKADKRIGQITVECECEPYKHRINKTVFSIHVDGQKTMVCSNLRRPVVPMITTSAAIQIKFNGGTYSLDKQGVYEVPEIEFKEGNNLLNIQGIAEVKIEYQEGCL